MQLLSFVAENERDNIHQRQAEGIAAAKARGVRFGRPPIETPVPFEPLAEKWIRGEVDTEEACKQLGLERSCFHHRVRKMKREKDVQKKEQEQEKPAPI